MIERGLLNARSIDAYLRTSIPWPAMVSQKARGYIAAYKLRQTDRINHLICGSCRKGSASTLSPLLLGPIQYQDYVSYQFPMAQDRIFQNGLAGVGLPHY